jgi:hypothetical protein
MTLQRRTWDLCRPCLGTVPRGRSGDYLTSFQYRGIAQLRVLRISKGPGLPPPQFD